jgi:hypothetical protein
MRCRPPAAAASGILIRVLSWRVLRVIAGGCRPRGRADPALPGAGWPSAREKDPAASPGGPVMEAELDDQAVATPGAMIPGRLRGADQRACSRARAGHANATAHRAVITITADHPSRGDARVVRRTARHGNVDDGEPHPGGGRGNGAQRNGSDQTHGR